MQLEQLEKQFNTKSKLRIWACDSCWKMWSSSYIPVPFCPFPLRCQNAHVDTLIHVSEQKNYLEHPVSIRTEVLYVQHHAQHFPLQRKDEKSKTTLLQCNLIFVANKITFLKRSSEYSIPAVRSCARMSTIFERCSGVSLQKRGSPRIACTRIWNCVHYTINHSGNPDINTKRNNQSKPPIMV